MTQSIDCFIEWIKFWLRFTLLSINRKFTRTQSLYQLMSP